MKDTACRRWMIPLLALAATMNGVVAAESNANTPHEMTVNFATLGCSMTST